MSDILIIIPARGGSKGIPRKNLRSLNGYPLLYYSIKNASSSSFQPDVFVSTDDNEIAFFAKKFGSKVYKRPDHLADDSTTLDPVIIDAFHEISSSEGKQYQFIITLQPTSPLLSARSIDGAIQQMLDNCNVDTIISVINDTHLTWRNGEDGFLPNYKERVNRQFLPKVYKETGGFLICKCTNLLNYRRRIGNAVSLYELPPEEATDIDTYEDWSICEYYLKRKHILFRVSGFAAIGLGHVYNTLIIASEILNHKITFLVDKESDLGYKKISENNFPVVMQKSDNILDDIRSLQPHMVINDCLDTSIEYVCALKAEGYKVINIEDLGEGSRYADVVINAIYPEIQKVDNHYYGPSYFCARDEFLFHNEKVINETVKSVLVTFGGVDPNNLTFKVLAAIYPYCVANKIEINVITGLGYSFFDSLTPFEDVNILKNVTNISDYIFCSDVAFSSAGRTVYELALIGTPSIILAQNDRELTHFFAYEEYGFENLGLGVENSEAQILQAFLNLILNHALRMSMSSRMMSVDITKGKKRVVELINRTIGRKSELKTIPMGN